MRGRGHESFLISSFSKVYKAKINFQGFFCLFVCLVYFFPNPRTAKSHPCTRLCFLTSIEQFLTSSSWDGAAGNHYSCFYYFCHLPGFPLGVERRSQTGTATTGPNSPSHHWESDAAKPEGHPCISLQGKGVSFWGGHLQERGSSSSSSSAPETTAGRLALPPQSFLVWLTTEALWGVCFVSQDIHPLSFWTGHFQAGSEVCWPEI